MSIAVHHPASVAQAVALARSLGDDARFLAGGTDLIVQMSRRRAVPEHLIDLGNLRELAGIEERPDGFVLGALTTHKTIECHSAFRGPLAALAEAARVVGGHQIRNRGTVGGNLVNASPAADVAVSLLALDAEVMLEGAGGSRVIRLEDFLLGPGRTVRRADELLTSVRFPRLPAASATTFLKAGRRRAMEISVVCVAARLTLDPRDGACRTVRIALGAVDDRTVRARAAEAMLQGRAAHPQHFHDAGRIAAQDCSPISDVRASSDYRRRLVAILVARVLARCVARIEEARR